MRGHASAQTAHLRVEAILDDLVQLRSGELRAVLEVGSVNFALQGAVEQEALLASFAAFLNSLTFPVQIVVRVLPLDLERHLGELERRALRELPEALADLARDHVAFLQRLARSRTLLERRFYLVVPARAGVEDHRRLWPLGKREAPGDLAAARRQLTFRCEEVERQLGRCGLSVRRLGNGELAELYYACWCPELSRVQRVRREIAEYTALVVSRRDQLPVSHRGAVPTAMTARERQTRNARGGHSGAVPGTNGHPPISAERRP